MRTTPEAQLRARSESLFEKERKREKMARTKQTCRKTTTTYAPACSSGGGGGGKRPGGNPNRRRGGEDKPGSPKSRKHGYCWTCGKENRAFTREVVGGSYEVCSVCTKRAARLIENRFNKNEVSFLN